MKSLKVKVLLTAVVIAFSGCQGGDKARPDDKAVITANEKSSAEELVASTEQLITPYSFMLAYRIAEMAVKKDPSNLKAKFYSLFLKRFEAFRGIAMRVRPMLSVDQNQQLDKSIAETPSSPLKDFLLAAGPEIKNEADAQLLIENYFSAVGEFRKFLKDNENAEFSVNFNPYVFQQPIRKEVAATYQAKEENGAITVNMEKTISSSKKLNNADLIVIRQMEGFELLYGSLFYSYDFSGISKLKGRKFNSKQEVIDALYATPEFGKLRQNRGFSELHNLGSDYSAAVHWLLDSQAQVCPEGGAVREGYAIARLCVKDAKETNRVLALLDSALKGVVEVDNSNLQAKVKMDFFAWSKTPVSDLRNIIPKLDSHDCAQSIQDNTFGGVFVDNNASAALFKACAP